jgi:deoxyribodipyrimidine photolyase-related protein
MVAPRLVLVLGDQLTPSIAALKAADMDRDIVVMVEVAAETGYVAHHPKKIAFVLSAMRKFAARLQEDGWRVCYTRLDDEDNAGSIGGELLRRAEEHGAKEVLATEPGEWRLIEALRDHPLTLHIQQDDRFICSHKEFEDWAEGRKSLRMEYFYREMRRKTGLLMEGNDPAGGAWNFDSDNRKSPPKGLEGPEPPRFEPDGVVRQVLDLVEARFSENFGKLRPFRFATDPEEAEKALDHFIAHALPCFGDYQDAMVRGQDLLFHSLLSPYMNVGLLDPLEVCRRVEAAWQAGDVPINAAEGFIRQIIGWREYVRGIYFLEGPDYTSRNALDHTRKLPALYWGGETEMRCLRECVDATRRAAYAHHIQRLMVTGNFALLAGVDPGQVHEWYLEVYADAYEWVEAPNTIGMSQFADGGIIASKPYVSSGNYIAKMSDYCKSCAYGVTVKTGEGACPFNLLYWHFLMRHRARFEDNPRMAQMYRTWERMDAEKRETVLAEAEDFLERMDAGEVV